MERRKKGSLFHMRKACIEKVLSWGDERLVIYNMIIPCKRGVYRKIFWFGVKREVDEI